MDKQRYIALGLGFVVSLTIAGAAAAQSAGGAQEIGLASAASKGQSGSEPQPATAQQPAPQQNQDSVADAARKAKEKSSASAPDASAPKKVYTNEDLRGMGRSDVSVVGNAKGPAKTGQTASNGQKDEKYWHDRMQKLRDEMAQVDRQIAQIEGTNQEQRSAAGGSNGSNGSNPPPAPLGAYTVSSHARGGNASQLEKLKERKAQIQQQMDQLEEEARRANVPPGWLR